MFRGWKQIFALGPGFRTWNELATWPKDFLQRVKGNLEASQAGLAPRYPFYVNALSVACMEGSSAYGKPVTDPVSHRPSLPCDGLIHSVQEAAAT